MVSGQEKVSIGKNVLSKKDDKIRLEARALIDKKEFKKPIGLLNDLIKDNPEVSELCYLLGICYINETRYLDAATVLSKAIEFDPAVSEYHSMLAMAYTRVGSFTLAIVSYDKALEFDENNINALVGIGDLFFDKEENATAKEYYLRAEKVKPSFPNLQMKLALTLSNLDEYKEALVHAEKSLRQVPDDSYNVHIIGRIHLVGGNLEEAIKSFKKAIDLDRTNGVAYYDLVLNQKIRDKDAPVFKQMESTLKKSLMLTNRQVMHFALGQAYHDSMQWDKAFENFNKGNLLIPTSYNKKKMLTFIADIKKIFSPSVFSKFQGVGNKSTAPIFIVGVPRSGSTLIDQVLTSHSNVFSVGESRLFANAVKNIIESDKSKAFPACIKRLTNTQVESSAEQYIDSILENAEDSTRVVNKMLFNYYYLGFIAILFPNAKIIHSMRHPLDSSLSSFFTNFALGNEDDEWRTSLDGIGFNYRLYHEIMEHWKKVLPIPILDIHYKDMVADLETNARKIIDFCDLEWEPQCLEFYKAKRSVQTASVSQVRQPIYKSSVSRWPPYAKHLGPLVEQLGDIVKDDYEQLRELGCEFKVKKGLLGKLFS